MYTLVVGFLVCLSAEPPHHRNENLNSDLNQLLEEVIREMDRLMHISCYLYIKVSFSKCVRLLSFSLFYFSILLLEVVETTFFFFFPHSGARVFAYVVGGRWQKMNHFPSVKEKWLKYLLDLKSTYLSAVLGSSSFKELDLQRCRWILNNCLWQILNRGACKGDSYFYFASGICPLLPLMWVAAYPTWALSSYDKICWEPSFWLGQELISFGVCQLHDD